MHWWSFHSRFITYSMRPCLSFSLDLIVVGVFGLGPNWPLAFPIIIFSLSSLYQVPYKHTHCALSSAAWKETIVWTGHELIYWMKDNEWWKTLKASRLYWSSSVGAVQAATGEPSCKGEKSRLQVVHRPLGPLTHPLGPATTTPFCLLTGEARSHHWA